MAAVGGGESCYYLLETNKLLASEKKITPAIIIMVIQNSEKPIKAYSWESQFKNRQQGGRCVMIIIFPWSV